MKDSTKRAIRTGIDVILGVLAMLVAVLPLLALVGVDPDNVAVLVGATVASTAAVSKIRNALEDGGYLKPRLK